MKLAKQTGKDIVHHESNVMSQGSQTRRLRMVLPLEATAPSSIGVTQLDEINFETCHDAS
jgi:hypothetical protein